ncbi:MAG: diaminopimelate epimerase [Jatrophihabitantaceae bacterium]
MHVLKGHGTENYFVLLPDLDGAIELTPPLVRALCDRCAGLGADGVLRIVRSENDPDGKELAAEAEFFMDYRNADGSIAEMCGNGVRVFLRYLTRVGLVTESAAVATRGGIVSVRSCTDGDISVQMGLPLVLADRPVVTAAPTAAPALAAVRMPNPHVVVQVAAADLDTLDLARAPLVEPPLPDGQNVEFVAVLGPRHLRMRVHERGVGETRSCGTGICAAVAAVATADGSGPGGDTWQVDVPGGTCRVSWHPDGSIELIGPAVIVADIEVDDGWLAGASG